MSHPKPPPSPGRSRTAGSPAPRRAIARVWVWVGLALLVLATATGWFLHQDRSTTGARTSDPASDPVASAPAPKDPAAPATNQFRRLIGRWLRTDGDYVIDVRYAGPDGRVEASYFNPRPIYVSRAESRQDSGQLKLFVELQDTGYPGCNYTLTFDPTNERLRGVYFQAALQESFDVEFEKLP